jgi:hypothetical protein
MKRSAIKSEVESRKSKVFCSMALACASFAATAQSFVVPAELWDRPRSGAAVLAQPAVRQAVERYLAQPGSRLVVHHGPAQESQLAAEELRSWLAALAIDPARIVLRGSPQGAEPLRIEVTP